jgi:hypothetical protein
VTNLSWGWLSPSTTYSWEVAAISNYGEGPLSSCVNATTYDLLGVPTGLTAATISSSAVNLTWTNPSVMMVNNWIYAYDGGSCSGSPFWIYDAGSPVTNLSWGWLSPSTTYSWEVAAISNYGEGPLSSCVNATTDNDPLGPNFVSTGAGSLTVAPPETIVIYVVSAPTLIGVVSLGAIVASQMATGALRSCFSFRTGRGD